MTTPTAENNDGTTASSRGVTGCGFVSGQGNPGGRPKGLAALVRAETDEGAELVAFMLRVLRSKRQPMRLRLEACSWLADRGFGKAVVQVDATMSATMEATVTPLDGVRARSGRASPATTRTRSPAGSWGTDLDGRGAVGRPGPGGQPRPGQTPWRGRRGPSGCASNDA